MMYKVIVCQIDKETEYIKIIFGFFFLSDLYRVFFHVFLYKQNEMVYYLSRVMTV